MLQNIYRITGDEDIGISSVALTELLHGIYRAKTQLIARDVKLSSSSWRKTFLSTPTLRTPQSLPDESEANRPLRGIPSHSRTCSLGPLLYPLGFSILTANERHFRLIPGLNVISF